ncbi:MAG: DUF4981 domain-containing protein, partial [Clostridia bacterium]|nr:DUF4981 domain-containing protein [Clostridia bacterium]
MKTILEYSYHRDPSSFRVNELPDHAYFIPFESAETAKNARESSPYFHSLCGNWRFLWKASLYDMDDFYKIGADLSEFESLSVPENWQMHGKDYAQYQTSPYPFLFDPPNVPEKNPCAAYVKDFELSHKEDKRYELHFEGKDSCIYVWMNGAFVGYGSAPHCTSAFDVTDFLQKGKNRLCVLVLKWCTTSYLDDQDKIRLSGIFRDVYILERAKNGLRDFTVDTDTDGRVTLRADANSPVLAQIFDGDHLLFEEALGTDPRFLQIEKPKLWSAEAPALYELRLSCAGEFVCHSFGLRRVEVKNSVFTVNGKPVKLYGVNRHDSSPDTGYVISFEAMKNELMQMKRCNVNAIRTAHYPNDPRFYQLCDELGFYVLSEADMESHGCFYVGDWNYIANDARYTDAILDRIDRMYATLRHFTCIVIWSLGNESGWGENFKKAAVKLRRADPSRPIQYEPASRIYHKLEDDEKAFIMENLDFVSHMYYSIEKTAQLYEDESITRPFVLCEYSHAMGNSCGDLRFYDDLIQSDDRYAGGFIWEWCDHAIRMQDENNVEFMGYGGDFGEKHHQSNICMDGVMTPDRFPHSSLREMKAVYAPIRMTREADGSFVIQNRNFFTNLSQYRIKWSVTVDGVKIAHGKLIANAAPCETCRITLPTNEPYHAENAVLTVKFKLAEEVTWATAKHTVAAFSFPLAAKKAEAPTPISNSPTLTETRTSYVISGNGFSYTFRKDEGRLTAMELDGKNLLRNGLTWNCFRAPTDNDNSFQVALNVANSWKNTRNFGNIEYPELSVRNFTAVEQEERIVLGGDFLFGVQGRIPICTGRVEYRVYGNGKLEITQKGSISERLPYFLPRYGYTLAFEKPIEDIVYYGYGPTE